MKKYFFLGFGVGMVLSGIILLIFQQQQPKYQNEKINKYQNLINNSDSENVKKVTTGFYVQLGTYKNHENCLSLKEKIEGIEVNIVEMEDGMHKVVSELFKTYNEAAELARFINREYNIESYVKRD